MINPDNIKVGTIIHWKCVTDHWIVKRIYKKTLGSVEAEIELRDLKNPSKKYYIERYNIVLTNPNLRIVNGDIKDAVIEKIKYLQQRYESRHRETKMSTVR